MYKSFGLCSPKAEYFTLKISVEWSLKYVDFYFRQGTMRRNNALLQQITATPELKSGAL